MIPHGGQNPLEAARLGNFIVHGPNIKNFQEVYSYLKINKVSSIGDTSSEIEKIILKKINKKVSNNTIKKITSLGEKILSSNLHEIKNYIK